MKKKSKYNYQKKKKGPSKALTITLLGSAILMTGLVTWLGMNEWSVEKSTKKFQEVSGLSTPIVKGTETPKEETDLIESPEVVVGGDGPEEPQEQSPTKEPEKPTTTPVKPAENVEKEPGATT